MVQQPTTIQSPPGQITLLLRGAESLRDGRDIRGAIANYLQIVFLDRNHTYARYWLASLYQQIGELNDAYEHCQIGLELDPGQVGMLLRMGSIATAREDHVQALRCYLRAAEIDPDISEIDAMIADQYGFLGQIDDSLAYFDRALSRDPTSARLQSNRLFVLNYSETISDQQRFDEHRIWGERCEKNALPHRLPFITRADHKKLRVGYVSGDLRRHAVAAFAESVLRCHDVERFEITCFDASRYPPDDVTQRLMGLGHEWRAVSELSDVALASAIRNSSIDILVDLSGHTAMNRLPAFALRPAPIQVTWLGYLHSTGLSSIDYRITDKYLDPPGLTESFHTESLVRLPNAACIVPPPFDVDVGSLPSARSEALTFASFNQWSKVTTRMKRLWCAILLAVPDSHLAVIAKGAQHSAFAAMILKDFELGGVNPGRITVLPPSDMEGFLVRLNEIDIALDTFPYGGGTTTMHCLWMGVPVITLAGATAFSRNAVGPLTETGLQAMIADSEDEYVRIAVETASDRAKLNGIRQSLRERLLASPLLDQSVFTKRLEDAYREMWRTRPRG